MPHVGGGGHCGGGGFHSFGGFHGSSSSHTPRFDKHGHMHSAYYIRPGFYYRCHYIPFSYRERRGIYFFASSIFLFITAIALAFFAGHLCTLKGQYDQGKLEDYGLEQYAEVYDSSSVHYEKNILVTFVEYKDYTAYDYVCINGDKVAMYVDALFGSTTSTFGKALTSNVSYSNYGNNLYSGLAAALNEVNDKIDSTGGLWSFFSASDGKNEEAKVNIYYHSKLTERTNGINDLRQAAKKFYSLTKYNITFVIDDNEHVYSIDWPLFGLLVSISAICVLLGFGIIVQKKKNIEFLEKEIQNGNAHKYFEGEDTFEEYCKEHPLNEYKSDNDDPFEKYDKNNDLDSL